MAAEIELKAHVDDWQALLARIRETSGISAESYQEKRDVYFARKGSLDRPMLRSRLELSGPDKEHLTGSVLLTCKDKMEKDGIEVNHEIEFSAPGSDFAQTIVFFKALGYEVWLEKEKIGYSFMLDKYHDTLHVELIEVPPLGWFLEMEFCLPDGIDKSQAESYRSYLMQALALFGIPADRLEDRYYMQMLKPELWH
jgi:adenylate cyclase class 2